MAAKLSDNALKVLERRYLKKDAEGKVVETVDEMFRRVAGALAKAEKLYGKKQSQIKKIEKDFYSIMSSLEFMPNSPTLMNAGRELGQLSACFLPDQLIITDCGPKPISQIREGDMVLTHKNRLRKVTRLFKRKSNEIYILDIFKLLSSTLKVTGEHPIWALKRGEMEPAWIHVSDLKPGDYVGLSF
ncbi:MAG TPA: hypothetical protein ENH41_05555, partial [Candidatus Omnitrophica bacterium]|nr:hypothetical protein [Candidatus Omnitrophota bacterium]